MLIYIYFPLFAVAQDLKGAGGELLDVSEYYFDGQGKMFRPMLVMLMAKAVNFHYTHTDEYAINASVSS